MIVPKFAPASKSFHAQLNARVGEYFKSTNQKMTGNASLFIKAIILFSSFIALYVHIMFFSIPNYVTLIECVLLGAMLAFVGFNIMHDGAHGSFSKNPKVNKAAAFTLNLIGGDNYLWKIKHNVIHHSYTNIAGVDEDIEIRPFLRLSPEQKRFGMHKYQHIYSWFLYCFLYIFWTLFTDFKKYFRGKIVDMPIKKMSTKESVLFFTFKAFHYFMFIILPIIKFGFTTWLIGYLSLAATTGILLAVVFQLAHAVEEAEFPVPDSASGKLEDEWAIHQIKTTANFATDNKIISWFVGGLNFQVEHHLYPNISHVHYPAINKIVKEICREFNVKYNEYPTMATAIASHATYLKTMGRS